jgi:hypothetical protein
VLENYEKRLKHCSMQDMRLKDMHNQQISNTNAKRRESGRRQLDITLMFYGPFL